MDLKGDNMNEEIILSMIKPYLKDKSLTYNQFESIFTMLSLKEKYGVINVLIKLNIDLVFDEFSNENNEEGNNFEILYDNSIFSNNKKDELDKVYVLANRQVNQNNSTLCKLIQDGNERAKQDLCIKNKGLVEKIANRCYKIHGNDLDFDDLVQFGLEGLLKAAERFNLDMDNAFSTYAFWWIYQSITRGIENYGFRIRVPVHMMNLISKVEKEERELAIYGYSNNDLIIEIQKRLNITYDKIMECKKIRKCYLSNESLNFQVGEDGDTEIQDLVIEDTKSIEDAVIENDYKIILSDIMNTLTEREQKVICLRFGLKDGKERTLEEVGKNFDVTRERIRQIEAKALRKLRHPSRSKGYKNYFE